MIEEFEIAAKWWASQLSLEPAPHPHIAGFGAIDRESAMIFEQALYKQIEFAFLPNWDRVNRNKGAIERIIYTTPKISMVLRKAAYIAMFGGITLRLPEAFMDVQPGIVKVKNGPKFTTIYKA